MDLTDIKLVKSATVTDTDANGGRAGHVEIVNGARQNVFPIVTAANRAAGVTRYRKLFFRQDADGTPPPVAYEVAMYLLHKTNGDDRKHFGLGTTRNTQVQMLADEPVWHSTGALAVALSGGESEIQITFESNDAEFTPGGELYISSRFLVSQTIADGVNPGDSVTYNDVAGEWQFAAFTTDVDYPNGRYIGDDAVFTNHDAANEERVVLFDSTVTGESIGTGDGTTTPSLSSLAYGSAGLYTHPAALRPIITFTSSGTERTVTVGADGTCAGYCAAGALNMATGAWTTPVTFTGAPDNGTDITVDYAYKFWTWSGNTATITLAGQIQNAYSTDDTYAGGCVFQAEVFADWDSETDASDICDLETSPVQVTNDGAEDDDFTITFTSGSAFTCSGLYAGAVGTGNTSADFAPVNPSTGEPFFTLPSAAWQGTPAAGNIVAFKTYAAVMAVWVRQTVPAGIDAVAHNHVSLEYSAQ